MEVNFLINYRKMVNYFSYSLLIHMLVPKHTSLLDCGTSEMWREKDQLFFAIINLVSFY